jgi:hypothetical protein
LGEGFINKLYTHITGAKSILVLGKLAAIVVVAYLNIQSFG